MPVWSPLSLLDLFFGVKGLVVPSEQSAPSLTSFPTFSAFLHHHLNHQANCLANGLANISAGK